MGRRDKIQGKQDRRDAKLLQRALARGDALELLPLASRATASLEPEVVAKTYAQDIAACLHRKDSARALQLAVVQAKHPVDLDALSPNEAMAARWTIIGVCLRHDRIEQAQAVLSELAPFLRNHAPDLLPWLEAAVQHGGRVPAGAAENLVELTEPPPTAWRFPEGLDTIEAFSNAVLAASTLMHPTVLAQSVSQHLGKVDITARADLAAAVMPIARLLAIEAASTPDRNALRASLNLVAGLCAHHLHSDTLSLGLRLSQFLEPNANAEDLRCVSHMLDPAVTRAELWPLALAAFEALSPKPNLRAPAGAVAQRIMSHTRSASVWARAFGWWLDDDDDDDDDDPPVWLADAYPHLVRSGELANWLRTADSSARRGIIEALNVFEWQLFLDLVETLWDGLPSFDHIWLARNVADCLTISEPLPSAQGSTRGSTKTAGAILRQLRRLPVDQDVQVAQEIAEIKRHLEDMAPATVLPGAFVSMVNALLDEDTMSLGPRQRVFIERMGERLVPHSYDLLQVALHDPELLRDGERWVDIHLGKDPLLSDLVAVADLIWDNSTWVALHVHIRQHIECRANNSLRDLEGLFRLLVENPPGPKALVVHLARALLAADERGECDGTPPWLISTARRLLPKPRKKKAKKKTTKKKTAKKTSATKKTAKKATTKKTTTKKTTTKKTSAKKKTAKTTDRQLDLLSPSSEVPTP